ATPRELISRLDDLSLGGRPRTRIADRLCSRRSGLSVLEHERALARVREPTHSEDRGAAGGRRAQEHVVIPTHIATCADPPGRPVPSLRERLVDGCPSTARPAITWTTSSCSPGWPRARSSSDGRRLSAVGPLCRAEVTSPARISGHLRRRAP